MVLPIVSTGSGIPLVLVPGIQGRWEYMRPTVDALARAFRVITFSLCGERTSGLAYDAARGLDSYVAQIERALDQLGVERAVVCGVSFGGVVALRFAAARPARTTALVLASTPGPGWHLSRRHELYAAVPWIAGPLFLVETPFRLRSEVISAIPDARRRRRFAWQQFRTLLAARVSFGTTAARAKLIGAMDLAGEAARVTAPTLVVTGEAGLDHVVPVDGASAYARLIRGARAAVLAGTGHIGAMTRPDAFAACVEQFVKERCHAAA